MPKRTTLRPPGPDEWAAERIRHERELRGWSTGELARRVTEAGVSLRQQQVWQIESGEPPRKLSVGEAAAFAKVFGITIPDLLAPPEEVASRNLVELGREFAEWRRDSGVLISRLREIDERVRQLEGGAEENFTATSVVKWMVPDELTEQAAAEFDEIAAVYTEIAQAIRGNIPSERVRRIWAVIAAMRELPASDAPGHGESIRRADRKNPPRSPKPGEQE